MKKTEGESLLHIFAIRGLFSGKSRMQWLIQWVEYLKFDSFSICLDECRILNFIQEFLDGNEIDETFFWERLKIL